VIARDIWRPIGAAAEGALLVSPYGAPGADGGLSARLRDVALFGLQFTAGQRRLAARPLISDRHLAAIRAGRPALYQARRLSAGARSRIAATAAADRPAFNAWQWDEVWADGAFYKGGWGGQGLYVAPDRDLVIAFFGTPRADGSINQLEYAKRAVAHAFGA
jgi:CubicO group peptidase (beta-lactamase class C family)